MRGKNARTGQEQSRRAIYFGVPLAKFEDLETPQKQGGSSEVFGLGYVIVFKTYFRYAQPMGHQNRAENGQFFCPENGGPRKWGSKALI